MNTNTIICHVGPRPSFSEEQLHPPASFFLNEIKNPLCNIYLASDLLKETSLDDQQRIYLGIIMRGASRINNLLNSILHSPPENEAEDEPCTLQQLLEDVLMRVKEQILFKQIEVSIDYPAFEDNICLNAAEARFVLTNILIDAIDSMPYAGGELRLITRSTGETSTVEIQNTGKHIAV